MSRPEESCSIAAICSMSPCTPTLLPCQRVFEPTRPRFQQCNRLGPLPIRRRQGRRRGRTRPLRRRTRRRRAAPPRETIDAPALRAHGATARISDLNRDAKRVTRLPCSPPPHSSSAGSGSGSGAPPPGTNAAASPLSAFARSFCAVLALASSAAWSAFIFSSSARCAASSCADGKGRPFNRGATVSFESTKG